MGLLVAASVKTVLMDIDGNQLIGGRDWTMD